MNRRAFFQNLAIGAAALAVDPERLLWMPGAKKIFVPKPHTTFMWIPFAMPGKDGNWFNEKQRMAFGQVLCPVDTFGRPDLEYARREADKLIALSS